MRVNTIGRTSIRVTGIGFGSAPIGNLYSQVSDETALGAVEAAWNAGIRYFDTAPHCGLGLAERRLGRALARYPRSEPAGAGFGTSRRPTLVERANADLG